MAQWVEVEGKQILKMDITGMTIEQYVEDIQRAAEMVIESKPAPNSVLLMACGAQPSGSLDEAKAAWKDFQEKCKGLIRGQAVVGLTGFKRIVARLVVRDLYFAESEDDAKRWLLKQ
jgi:hypothetical protein